MMEDVRWVVTLIASGGALLVAVVGKLMSRRQDKAAGDMSTATAAKAIQEAAAGMVGDLRQQISDLKDRVVELERDRDRAYSLLRANGISINTTVPAGPDDAGGET
jgi:hypothetical protein